MVLCSFSLSLLGSYWGGGFATNIRWSNRRDYHRYIILRVSAPQISAVRAEESVQEKRRAGRDGGGGEGGREQARERERGREREREGGGRGSE